MQNSKHIHKLKRHKYKTGNTVFFCTLPDCGFKIDVALSLGKRTLCNLCNTEFIINEYTMKLARPHCENCSKQKVRGVDGKNHYVRKSNIAVLSTIADENAEDLRLRLENAISPTNEGDI